MDIIKQRRRNAISRDVRTKNDKEKIAGWRRTSSGSFISSTCAASFPHDYCRFDMPRLANSAANGPDGLYWRGKGPRESVFSIVSVICGKSNTLGLDTEGEPIDLFRQTRTLPLGNVNSLYPIEGQRHVYTSAAAVRSAQFWPSSFA